MYRRHRSATVIVQGLIDNRATTATDACENTERRRYRRRSPTAIVEVHPPDKQNIA